MQSLSLPRLPAAGLAFSLYALTPDRASRNVSGVVLLKGETVGRIASIDGLILKMMKY